MTQPAVPGIAYLDAARLNRALRAGIARLLADRTHLNRINVFPVADGDTGTNLALTCAAIASVLDRQPTGHAGELLMAVADAALDGARGNSGAILAQFFQGLADAAERRSRIDAAALAHAFAQADDYARTAMDEPKEGTILTVISAAATAMRGSEAGGQTDIRIMINDALIAGREALEETRNGLEAMRKAGVVDAGAGGFIDLLEGIAGFLEHGSLRDVPQPAFDPDDLATSAAAAAGETDIEFRFCTECIVGGDALDRRRIREMLAELGNSLVMAGTRRKLKVHIHTDHPEQVFQLAAEYGQVTGCKADDMRAQSRTIRRFRDQAVIVTDSAADMPDDVLEKFGIYIVPLRINFGERSYLDKISLTATEFFAALRESAAAPTTSQPAPGDFRRTFEFLASHFRHVVVISLAEKLSGTYQAALTASARIDGPGRISVVNSRNVSLGQGLIAIRAAEYVQDGYTGERLIRAIERDVRRTRSFGVVAELDYAVRGGRLGAGPKRVADWLGVRPIFRMTGAGDVVPAGIMPRRADRPARLARHIARRLEASRTYRVAVGHGDSEKEAMQLRDLLARDIRTRDEIRITELGSVLGAHTGPGTLVAAVQET